VGPAEYAGEVARVVEFLRTGGRSLLDSIARSRDRLSEEMQFEEAARRHKRFEKVQDVLKLRDELAVDVDRLDAVAIAPSSESGAVELWIVRGGHLQRPERFFFEARDGAAVSLDRRLRDTFATAPARKLDARARRETLALLARWAYSSWRDGEWLAIENFDDLPYRKLVNAVSRVAHGRAIELRGRSQE
jgi:hypothetical protein